ncbi:MAG: hypothetical protein GVY23_02940 [Spirochaetes bacterium]|jgi:hypothetical protein|nr:hypothetical protein [Spirochaetota bacterium]
MRIDSFYPVLMCEGVSELSVFYQEHFGFACSFETEWYVSLMSAEEGGRPFELAILSPTRQRRSDGYR